jgi:hypothetical protein
LYFLLLPNANIGEDEWLKNCSMSVANKEDIKHKRTPPGKKISHLL